MIINAEKPGAIRARKKTGRTIALLCLVLFVGACRAKPLELTLDPTPLLTDGLGWGVVSLAYSRLKAEPDPDAADSAYVRKGEVLELLSRTRSFVGPGRGVWYKVRAGETTAWLHESALRVFDSKSQADRAADAAP